MLALAKVWSDGGDSKTPTRAQTHEKESGKSAGACRFRAACKWLLRKAVRRSHLLRMLTRMVTTVAKVMEFYVPEKLRSANLVLGKAELGIAMDELKINLQ